MKPIRPLTDEEKKARLAAEERELEEHADEMAGEQLDRSMFTDPMKNPFIDPNANSFIGTANPFAEKSPFEE